MQNYQRVDERKGSKAHRSVHFITENHVILIPGSFQLQRNFAPDLLTRDSASGPAGGSTPNPCYRLALAILGSVQMSKKIYHHHTTACMASVQLVRYDTIEEYNAD